MVGNSVSDETAELESLASFAASASGRSIEGQAISRFILSSITKIVALYGKPGSGKSELMRRFVLPRLREERQVFYSDRFETPLTVAGSGQNNVDFWTASISEGIIVLDRFEDFFGSERTIQSAFLTQLSERLGRGQFHAILVLVFRHEYLSRLLSLRDSLPQVLDEAREIEGIQSAKAADTLRCMALEKGLRLDEAATEKFAIDLQKLQETGSGLSPELLAILVFQICRVRARSSETAFGSEDYEAAGGIIGILGNYLDYTLDGFGDDETKQLAGSILGEIVNASRVGTSPNFEDVGNRLDSSDAAVRTVLNCLEQERKILRKTSSGLYEVIPLQLSQIIEESVVQEEKANLQTKALLREGVKIFSEQGVILPEPNFRKIHLKKSSLKATDDDTKLMLRCSLVYEDSKYEGATRHWLRRLKDWTAKLDILLTAAFDPRPPVRARAASFLGAFDKSEVRSELQLLALRDPSESVRKIALGSLEKLKDEALRESFVQEINDKNSPHRETAIAALKIFPDGKAADLLLKVVTDPNELAVRTRAIGTLSEMGTPEALDVLVRIALESGVEEDRHAAAKALRSTHEENLIRRIFDKLRREKDCEAKAAHSFAREPVGRRVRNAVLAGCTVGAGLLFPGLILCFLRRFQTGISLMILEVLGAGMVWYGDKYSKDNLLLWGFLLVAFTLLSSQLIAVGVLLREKRDKRWREGSYRAFLTLWLYALNILPFVGCIFWIHGSAHMITKRFVKGANLFAFELAGILLAGVSFLQDFQSFPKVKWSYLVTGIVLILFSYVYDVFVVFRDSVLFPRKRERRQRIETVLQEVMRNRESAVIILRMIDGSRGDQAQWAAKTLKKFAAVIDPTPMIECLNLRSHPVKNLVVRCLEIAKTPVVLGRLSELWKETDAATKEMIVKILTGHPTEESLATLRDLTPGLSFWGQLKYLGAEWAFRFKVWPKSLLAFLALGLSVLIGLVFVGIHPMTNRVKDEAKQAEVRIEYGRLLAQENPKEAVSTFAELLAKDTTEVKVKQGIAELLEGIAENSIDQASKAQETLVRTLKDQKQDTEYRRSALQAVEHVALYSRASEEPAATVVPVIYEILRNSEEDAIFRRSAIDALAAIGTTAACDKLQEFVKYSQTPEARPGSSGKILPTTENPQGTDLRGHAILALSQVTAATHLNSVSKADPVEAFEVLQELSTDEALDVKLQEKSKAAAEGLGPSVKAEYDFREKKYKSAIRDAEDTLDSVSDQSQVARAYEIMGLAYYREAQQGRASPELWQKVAVNLQKAADTQKSLDYEGYIGLSSAYYVDGEFDKARPLLRKAIGLSPKEGLPFVLLREMYLAQDKIDDGIKDFERLGAQYPESIYPGLTLAFIYHENKAPNDPSFYAKAYEIYPALLHLKLSESDLFLVKENFVETNLTTGRYPEVRRIASELLDSPQADVDKSARLNLRFLILASLLLEGKRDDYGQQLNELLALYGAPAEGINNTWTYDGTRHYVNFSNLSRDDKRILVSLTNLIEGKRSKHSLMKFCQQLSSIDHASYAKVEAICSK